MEYGCTSLYQYIGYKILIGLSKITTQKLIEKPGEKHDPCLI